MGPTLDRTARVTGDTVFREVSGEAVLLQLERGMYYGLDPVGTRLWVLIVEHGSLQAVFDRALAEFDVSGEQLRSDLLDLVAELESRGLLAVE